MMPGQRAGRILFVDDNEDIRQLVVEILQGYMVATAPNVDTALSVLAQHAFDVVITDYSMPGRTGLDLIREIHQHFAQTRTILVSGHGNVKQLAKVCGADQWFLKGVSPLTELRMMIAQLLES